MINRYIIFCFTIIVFALGVSFYPKSSGVTISLENDPLSPFPEIKVRSVANARVEVSQSELLREINIQIRATKAPEVTISGAKMKYNCAESRCTVSFWSSASSEVNVNIVATSSDSQFTIEGIVLSKEKYQSAITDGILKEAAILLLLLYPVYFLVYKKTWLSQWLLISLSFYLLAKIQLMFSFALAGYLLISFFAPKAENKTIRRVFKPFYIVASAVLFFIIFKFMLVHIQYWSLQESSYSLAVPVGISYFLLRIIDAQLKWYRGELKNVLLREYLLFVGFLPTVPAGPIDTLDNFIKGRVDRISQQDIRIGFARFFFGVFQKLVLADFLLAPLLGSGYDPQTLEGYNICLKLIFTFLFIYMDFSAYSNIAIGLSRLLGYKIIENFNWPVLALTPRDFWKRWHISLSVWCMRNVYFPLIVKTKSAKISVFMVMLTIGMWHAVSLSWFLWAVHHSLGILASGLIEKYLIPKNLFKSRFSYVVKTIPSRIVTLVYICAGYSFAQFSDINLALNMYFSYWEYVISPLTRLVSWIC
ncbi:MBOAT family O-acyltransferase [Cellvibrio sp.]|uniref:MBOAT family O-acyltransferase n=1 Tax=Cellvibrio sp. TaxID=1965322 RepID=UPI0039647868